MKKSKTLTFFLSAVPGLGHYYLGQMNRGLQMMLLFFGSMFLFNFLGFDFSFPFLLPVIWFYSLFDALQQHRNIEQEQAIIDPPIISWSKLNFKKPWIGWGLIIFGIYLIFQKLSFQFFGYRYYDTARSVILAVILIVTGWYLLTGRKKITKNIENEVN